MMSPTAPAIRPRPTATSRCHSCRPTRGPSYPPATSPATPSPRSVCSVLPLLRDRSIRSDRSDALFTVRLFCPPLRLRDRSNRGDSIRRVIHRACPRRRRRRARSWKSLIPSFSRSTRPSSEPSTTARSLRRQSHSTSASAARCASSTRPAANSSTSRTIPSTTPSRIPTRIFASASAPSNCSTTRRRSIFFLSSFFFFSKLVVRRSSDLPSSFKKKISNFVAVGSIWRLRRSTCSRSRTRWCTRSTSGCRACSRTWTSIRRIRKGGRRVPWRWLRRRTSSWTSRRRASTARGSTRTRRRRKCTKRRTRTSG
mmetsp:Transcript_5942/g.19307  ORF Transcript_5942/g.19307 Transcript_5942/m.19307 type:complete len:312 (-) Transcript_5942:583-1518(-)